MSNCEQSQMEEHMSQPEPTDKESLQVDGSGITDLKEHLIHLKKDEKDDLSRTLLTSGIEVCDTIIDTMIAQKAEIERLKKGLRQIESVCQKWMLDDIKSFPGFHEIHKINQTVYYPFLFRQVLNGGKKNNEIQT